MKYLLLCIAAMFSYASFAQFSPEELRNHAESEKHQQRVQERELRAAEHEQKMDSIIMSKDYTFTPSSYYIQPPVTVRLINNPMVSMIISNDLADIYLPYLSGVVAPYRFSMWNYSVEPKDYAATQTDSGWNITFSSNLFSVNTYTFTLTVYSPTGEATLDIATPFSNTVSYSGSISGNN